MSLRHPKAEEWELRLKRVFDEIDRELEERYGHMFHLHPARPAGGETGNPEFDGLFEIGASFTPGYDSEVGSGYVVSVRIATLDEVPESWRERLLEEVAERLRQKLPQAFPDQELRVSRDGRVYRIHGDLHLGSA